MGGGDEDVGKGGSCLISRTFAPYLPFLAGGVSVQYANIEMEASYWIWRDVDRGWIVTF